MKQLGTLILILFLAATGCSEKSGNQGSGGNPGPSPVPNGDPTTSPPPVGTTTPPIYTTGATAALHVNLDVFDEYTGRLPNAPDDFKINIDLHDVGLAGTSHVYGGGIKISYRETVSNGNYTYIQGSFVSGNTVSEARYNTYANYNTTQAFKAFFEDAMGGIVIVALPDEAGNWSGKVFFKNFNCPRNSTDPACNSIRPRRCWLVSLGPYDCTAFKTGGTYRDPYDSNYIIWKVNMSYRYEPEDYTLLGTFSDMNPKQALNKP